MRRALRLGLLAGIAAPIVSWALGLVVMASWPGYDPIRQSISLLATAPLGWIENLGFALAGLLNLAWAFALARVLGATPRERTFVVGSQVLQGLIVLAFAVFPTDPDAAPVSTIGQLHLANYGLYALSMPLTLLLLGLVMRRDPRWSATAARLTLLAAALAIVGIGLTPATLSGPLRPWLGLLERLFVAIPSVWQVASGAYLLKRPRATTS